MRRGFAFVAGLAGSLLGGRASAGDGNVPPPPPTLAADVCLVQVDRSVDPVVVLPYGLTLEAPQDGTELLPDARSHQFLALCREASPADPLPQWVHLDDAQRSAMVGLLGVVPPAEQIVELAPAFQLGHDGSTGTCLQLIDLPAERRPITCAAAEAPVAWDTSGVPAGSYVIHAHAFDPLPNGWTRRAGVVRIHDGDPDSAGPAAALLSPHGRNLLVFAEDGFELRACAAGAQGTNLVIEYARVVVPNLWTPIASVPLDSDACGLSVTWEPPNPPPLGEVMFRAVATDLQGRTFVAYAPGTVGVLAGSGAGDSPAPPPFTDPACGGVGETSPALPECNAAGGSGSSSGPATGGSTSGSGTAADSGTSEPTTSTGTNGDTGSGAASTITATTTSSASSVGDGEAESVASASCTCRSQPGDLPVATLLAGLLLARRRRH